MVLRSSHPLFGVRTDGSIFAAGEASLDEPVQFKLTAEGPRAHVWETVVQLALIDPPPAPQKENEVSSILHTRSHRQIFAPVYRPLPLVHLDFQSGMRSKLLGVFRRLGCARPPSPKLLSENMPYSGGCHPSHAIKNHGGPDSNRAARSHACGLRATRPVLIS